MYNIYHLWKKNKRSRARDERENIYLQSVNEDDDEC